MFSAPLSTRLVGWESHEGLQRGSELPFFPSVFSAAGACYLFSGRIAAWLAGARSSCQELDPYASRTGYGRSMSGELGSSCARASCIFSATKLILCFWVFDSLRDGGSVGQRPLACSREISVTGEISFAPFSACRVAHGNPIYHRIPEPMSSQSSGPRGICGLTQLCEDREGWVIKNGQSPKAAFSCFSCFRAFPPGQASAWPIWLRII